MVVGSTRIAGRTRRTSFACTVVLASAPTASPLTVLILSSRYIIIINIIIVPDYSSINIPPYNSSSSIHYFSTAITVNICPPDYILLRNIVIICCKVLKKEQILFIFTCVFELIHSVFELIHSNSSISI